MKLYGWDRVMGLHGNRLVGKPHQQLRELTIPDEGLVTYLKGYGWVKAYFKRRWSVKVLH